MDDTTLLCERCGYTLEGLPHTGACPECGVPIRESLPAQRIGSPWQRSPGARSWLATNIGTVRSPRDRFRSATIEARRPFLLLTVNSFLAGLLVALPWTGVLIGDPSRGGSGLRGQMLFIIMLIAWAALIAATLVLLTFVERAGVRFFAARRRWRLSAAAAWQVCGHASVGWIVAPLAAFLCLVVLTILERVFGIAPRGIFRVRLGTLFQPGPIGWGDFVYSVILGGSALAGLLAFEMLVYVGVRECRFANAPGVGEGTRPAPLEAAVKSS